MVTKGKTKRLEEQNLEEEGKRRAVYTEIKVQLLLIIVTIDYDTYPEKDRQFPHALLLWYDNHELIYGT